MFTSSIEGEGCKKRHHKWFISRNVCVLRYIPTHLPFSEFLPILKAKWHHSRSMLCPVTRASYTWPLCDRLGNPQWPFESRLAHIQVSQLPRQPGSMKPGHMWLGDALCEKEYEVIYDIKYISRMRKYILTNYEVLTVDQCPAEHHN